MTFFNEKNWRHIHITHIQSNDQVLEEF